MVITCFNPDLPVCDDGAGGGTFFSNLRPGVAGQLSVPATMRFAAARIGSVRR
jgi:hypothetical protein